MDDRFEALVGSHPAWWIDFLGEHGHIGGEASTRWLAEHARLGPGTVVLDAGSFVGAAARMLACEWEARPIATDAAADFLAAGAHMPGGGSVRWVEALTQRLPFADSTFGSVWCLDSLTVPRELSRVAAKRATLCLCTEVPDDERGGTSAFFEEWEAFGWRLRAHKTLSLEATNAWRKAEGEMVRRRPHFEERYGRRGYNAQLDQLAGMLRSYELREQGHGLFVFERG